MMGVVGAGEGLGSSGQAGDLTFAPWGLPEEGQVACPHEVVQRASCCRKEGPEEAYSQGEDGEPW